MSDPIREALQAMREEWDAMAPEEQDALIASGWHPGPSLQSHRYQTGESPHNKVKAPRSGNYRGRDTTEVPVMPDQFNSEDTPDSPGRIVGVEDAEDRAWCFECADAEIRRAGPTAFMADLYAGWSARRKCVNCGRRIGEVGG